MSIHSARLTFLQRIKISPIKKLLVGNTWYVIYLMYINIQEDNYE